tara:strand:+ start:935 stop:2047 length:1113 start_codon:yes stop_codon:yes gene_type:complete
MPISLGVFLSTLTTTSYVFDKDEIDSDLDHWTAYVKTNDSKVPIRCTKCGIVGTPTIKNFLRNSKTTCFCSGKARWGTRHGFERCVCLLDEQGHKLIAPFDSVENWTTMKIGAVSKLNTQCTRCLHVSSTSMPNSLATGHMPACWCNGGAESKDPEFKSKLCTMIKERSLAFVEQPAWQVLGVDVELDMKCTKCGVRKKTLLKSLLKRGVSFACACVNKTEGVVARWLQELVDGLPDNVSCVFQYRNPWRKHTTFDFAVLVNQAPILLIEVDGQQHFEFVHHISHTHENFERQMENDFCKECDAVENNTPLVRLYQADIWEERVPWRDAVKSVILEAVAGKLKCAVYRQDCKWYDTKMYVDRRVGTIVAL